jgi:hypothetical protein
MKKLMSSAALLLVASNAFAASAIDCKINGGTGAFGEEQIEGTVEISKDGRIAEEGNAHFLHAVPESTQGMDSFTIEFYARKYNSQDAFRAYRAQVGYYLKTKAFVGSIGEPSTGMGAYSTAAPGEPLHVEMLGVSGLLAGSPAYLALQCSLVDAPAPANECVNSTTAKEIIARYRDRIKATPGVTGIMSVPGTGTNSAGQKCATIQINVKDEAAKSALEKNFGSSIESVPLKVKVTGVVRP